MPCSLKKKRDLVDAFVTLSDQKTVIQMLIMLFWLYVQLNYHVSSLASSPFPIAVHTSFHNEK